MISDEGFKKACQILTDPKPIGATTALLPEIVLEDVLTRINGEADQCGLAMGKALLDRLTDGFPAYDRKAHKRYLESLVELFSIAPLSAGNAAVDRLKQYTEFPSTGDVGKELKLETDRRTIIRSAAVAHQHEREVRVNAKLAQDEFDRARAVRDPAKEAERIRKLEAFKRNSNVDMFAASQKGLK